MPNQIEPFSSNWYDLPALFGLLGEGSLGSRIEYVMWFPAPGTLE